MKNRPNSGLIGRARRVLSIGVPAVGLAVAMIAVAPAQQAFAQDIGADIAAAVTDAVSGIATASSSGDTTAIGGILTEHNEIDLGDDESTAIADSSGGNRNVSDNPSRHDRDDDDD